MHQHKFKVGQAVLFSQRAIIGVPRTPDEQESYNVLRLLPADGKYLQYRIKGAVLGQERMATEDELRVL
jgi:hypothetical protein